AVKRCHRVAVCTRPGIAPQNAGRRPVRVLAGCADEAGAPAVPGVANGPGMVASFPGDANAKISNDEVGYEPGLRSSSSASNANNSCAHVVATRALANIDWRSSHDRFLDDQPRLADVDALAMAPDSR